MNKIYQTTLTEAIKFEGIGLHSGQSTKITVLPAEVNSGIVFKRIDLKDKNLIKAVYSNVSSTQLCTTLKNEHGAEVSTVEHLMAALYLAEIDNALIEISSKEVPIMDGSAAKFLEKFDQAEIKNLPEKRKYLKITDKVEIVDGEKKISIEPNDETFQVEFQLNYENKVIGNQKNKINFNKDSFDDISKSRTFCLFNDIEKIKKIGLAKGGSLDNAIVVDENKVINKNGLRNEKEFVNHKILDLAGDFLLSGYRILGKVQCYQGGHQLSNNFLKKLFNHKKFYSIVNLEQPVIVKNIESIFKPKQRAINA
jgi:UDP-3-O-[3-hydroxymyristoyl] N-acetylglucosamine deacetylase